MQLRDVEARCLRSNAGAQGVRALRTWAVAASSCLIADLSARGSRWACAAT